MLMETKKIAPAESAIRCADPVTLPERAISAGETTTLWSADRSALRVCEQRRAAAVQAFGGAQ